jgi:hypothetical protein
MLAGTWATKFICDCDRDRDRDCGRDNEHRREHLILFVTVTMSRHIGSNYIKELPVGIFEGLTSMTYL